MGGTEVELMMDCASAGSALAVLRQNVSQDMYRGRYPAGWESKDDFTREYVRFYKAQRECLREAEAFVRRECQ
jgi:hypothetical protein